MELKNQSMGAHDYKHAAPTGADSPAPSSAKFRRYRTIVPHPNSNRQDHATPGNPSSRSRRLHAPLLRGYPVVTSALSPCNPPVCPLYSPCNPRVIAWLHPEHLRLPSAPGAIRQTSRPSSPVRARPCRTESVDAGASIAPSSSHLVDRSQSPPKQMACRQLGARGFDLLHCGQMGRRRERVEQVGTRWTD